MTTVLSSRDSTREFAFEKADFHKVQNMLFKKAGIKLSDAKEAMVYSRLARRIRALQLTSFNDYLGVVDKSEPELEQFINALTTNHTSGATPLHCTSRALKTTSRSNHYLVCCQLNRRRALLYCHGRRRGVWKLQNACENHCIRHRQ